MPVPCSNPAPPRNVLYRSDPPVGSSFATAASEAPFAVVSNAPAVVGQFVDRPPMDATTYTLPVASTAMSAPLSLPDPPRMVLNTSAPPVGSISATNASGPLPSSVVSNAPDVVGKLNDDV